MREFAMAIAVIAVPAWAWGSAQCVKPESDFGAFASRFASDKAFRLERVSLPLTVVVGDGAAREQVHQRWSRAQFEQNDAPLFLSTAKLKRRGLSQRIRPLSVVEREVYQFRPEADSLRHVFNFRQIDGCWHLVSFADISL
jgi:hypothetical protein